MQVVIKSLRDKSAIELLTVGRGEARGKVLLVEQVILSTNNQEAHLNVFIVAVNDLSAGTIPLDGESKECSRRGMEVGFSTVKTKLRCYCSLFTEHRMVPPFDLLINARKLLSNYKWEDDSENEKSGDTLPEHETITA